MQLPVWVLLFLACSSTLLQPTLQYGVFKTRSALRDHNLLDIERATFASPILTSLKASNRWEPPTAGAVSGNNDPVDEESGVAYTVELPKATGITWGSDLSFRFVYVQDIDSSGAAASTGMVRKGDYIIACDNTSVLAQDFNSVLSVLAETKNSANLTFFRGSKSQMLGSEVIEPSDTVVNVRVVQKGKPDRVLQCPGGTNLRTLLVGNGINVYRSLTRWTNCNGQQRCGTCIVDIQEGMGGCSQRSLDEEMILQENPDSYRLSCITNIYSDVTVEVLGPVGAAQWTR